MATSESMLLYGIAQDSTGTSATLTERMLVAGVGPVVGAVLGTGLISLIVWKLQYIRMERDKEVERQRLRTEKETELQREEASKRLEQQQADNALRNELIASMTAAAATLYLSLQHCWRQLRKENIRAAPAGRDILETATARYLESRAVGEVLEAKLVVYFGDREPRDKWHKVTDLLTVRYFQLIGEDTEALYRENSIGFGGEEHSGLTIEDLRNPSKLLEAYRAALSEALESVFTSRLRDRAAKDRRLHDVPSFPLPRRQHSPVDVEPPYRID